MRTKSVVKFLSCFALSLISSVQATLIIAPLLKASKNGNIFIAKLAVKQASTAKIGSTIPENAPHKNDLKRPMFALRIGSETLAPSGKF